MPARFEYYKDPEKKKPWSFVLRDPSGNPLMFSRDYLRRTSARRAVESVREGALDKGRFILRCPRHGVHRFVMKSGDSQVVCTSNDHMTRKAASRAMNKAMKYAAEADEDDLRSIRILVSREELK